MNLDTLVTVALILVDGCHFMLLLNKFNLKITIRYVRIHKVCTELFKIS